MNLRYYETLMIVHPNYEQDRLKAIIDSVTDEIKKLGGELLNVADWGKRRLAYPIQKQKYGTYVLIHFSAVPSVVNSLYAWMKLQSTILSEIIVKLESAPEIGKQYIIDEDDIQPGEDFDIVDEIDEEDIEIAEDAEEESDGNKDE